MADPDEDEIPATWYMVVIPAVMLTLAFGLPLAYLLWVSLGY